MTRLGTLLYADSILLAETEHDLQCMSISGVRSGDSDQPR